ncbi:MAG: DEAD/DEAH box helicase [Bacteroidetes bacterium]|nr:MAG: DEAD/DEAH box helicase [Bacteroidota bacterium]
MIIMYNKVLSINSMALVESDNLEALRGLLTITSTDKEPYTLKLYTEVSSNSILIPRGLIKERHQVKHFNKLLSSKKSSIVLRDIQEKIIKEFIEKVDILSPYGGIIKAPTGSGKTVMAIELMFRLGYKTLIIVPTDRLMTQWIEQLKSLSNLTDYDIGVIKQNRCEYSNRLVSVAMVHSLAKDKYPKEMYDEFGTIIYDEVHTLGAETFSKTASMFNSKYRIGLSATPRRKDGMENVFFYHIGEILCSIDNPTDKPSVIMDYYYDINTHHKGCVWGGNFILPRYLNRLSKNVNRNKRIAKYVQMAFTKKRKTLVLSDRIEQLKGIHREIISLGIIKDNIGFCIGDEKQLDRDIILGTYGSAGMGMDIPGLSCLIFATPRTDIEQAVGRILRHKRTEVVPIVVDIIDEASLIMKKWSDKRLKFYKQYADDIKYIRR